MYYDTLGCSSSGELIINTTYTNWFNIALICIRKIQVCPSVSKCVKSKEFTLLLKLISRL